MPTNGSDEPTGFALGIEGGGTRTSVVLLDDKGRTHNKMSFPAANLQLLTDAELAQRFRAIAQKAPDVQSIGVGMAGVRTADDRQRVRMAAARQWPGAGIYITDDLESLLASVNPPVQGNGPRVLLVSGTGSCCLAVGPQGQRVKVGGWGHLLGDQWGGYGIGLRGLQQLVAVSDRTGTVPVLGRRVLRKLGLANIDGLIPWIHAAAKPEIAALAPVMFQAWRRGDAVASGVIDEAIDCLVGDAQAAVRRLKRRRAPLFVLSGSCLVRQRAFAQRVITELRRLYPKSEIRVIREGGARGAALLGRTDGTPVSSLDSKPDSRRDSDVVPASIALSPTEERNPRSLDLDRLSVREAILLMCREDRRLPVAVEAEASAIERVVGWVARGLRLGGRLIYVGAGTSGRLGVLDASECPPTFRTDPDQVVGLIAGGKQALWRSVEGAEDNVSEGRDDLCRLDVTARDVVVGIAASGRTPYVWGALAAARAAGAKTALICFNPHLRFARGGRPNAIICPKIGAEVLTGSTRLKAGTATKLVLNMITTLAMVRLGKVIENLMIDVNPSNVKLRDRAIRIVRELTRCSRDEAEAALEREGWVVKAAYQRLRSRRKGSSRNEVSAGRRPGARSAKARRGARARPNR